VDRRCAAKESASDVVLNSSATALPARPPGEARETVTAAVPNFVAMVRRAARLLRATATHSADPADRRTPVTANVADRRSDLRLLGVTESAAKAPSAAGPARQDSGPTALRVKAQGRAREDLLGARRASGAPWGDGLTVTDLAVLVLLARAKTDLRATASGVVPAGRRKANVRSVRRRNPNLRKLRLKRKNRRLR
jgi:hypothetical protein